METLKDSTAAAASPAWGVARRRKSSQLGRAMVKLYKIYLKWGTTNVRASNSIPKYARHATFCLPSSIGVN